MYKCICKMKRQIPKCTESKLYYRSQCSEMYWKNRIAIKLVCWNAIVWSLSVIVKKRDLYATANSNLHINKLVIHKLPVSRLFEWLICC